MAYFRQCFTDAELMDISEVNFWAWKRGHWPINSRWTVAEKQKPMLVQSEASLCPWSACVWQLSNICNSWQETTRVSSVNSPCNHNVLAFIPDFSLQGLVIQTFVGECIQMSTWRRWLGKLSAFKIFKEQLRLKHFWNHMIQNYDVSKAPRAWNCSITLMPPTHIIIRYFNSCIKT